MSDFDDIVRSAQRAAAACAGLAAPEAARLLAEAGLFGVLASEEAGGLGLPLSAAAAVLAATEAELLAYPLLETMLAARVLPAEQAAAVVAGETRVTIAWAGGPGMATRAPGAEAAALLLYADGQGGGLAMPLAPGAAEPEPDLDLERPSARVRTQGGTPIAPAAWAALLADTQLLRAAECLGAADASIAAAVAHVSQRRQFGRLLVTMQGLRFELARQKLALENARVVLTRALTRQGDAHAALVARACVAEVAPLVIEGAIQLHGGMGFTWDVPLHRRLRRVLNARTQLDAFGAKQALLQEIAA